MHQTGLGLANQRLHLRVAGAVLQVVQENQAMHASFGGAVELPLGRGVAFGILGSVIASEQPHIKIAPLHFVQIKLIGPPVRRGKILKQKGIEKAS